MKTVMKKLLSIALVAVLLISAVPFQADATTDGPWTVQFGHRGTDGQGAFTPIKTVSVDVPGLALWAFPSDKESKVFGDYRLVKWVVDGTEVTFNNGVSLRDYDLNNVVYVTAVYERDDYTLKFNANMAGVENPASITITNGWQYGAHNNGALPPLANTATQNFLGWVLPNGNMVGAGDYVETTSNITLTAKWSNGAKTVTVQYWNGSDWAGLIAPFSVETNTAGVVGKYEAFKTAAAGDMIMQHVPQGFELKGWTNAATGAAFDPATAIVTEDITIRPVYTGKITLDPNCPNPYNTYSRQIEVTVGKKMTNLPTLGTLASETKAYVFNGWYIPGNDTLITSETPYYPSMGTELKADWANGVKITLYIYDTNFNLLNSKEAAVYAAEGKQFDLTKVDPATFVSGYAKKAGWFTTEQFTRYKAGYSATPIEYIQGSQLGHENYSTFHIVVNKASTNGNGGTGTGTNGTGNGTNEKVDPSNPQTGDMIGVSLALMMSTAGAAVMLGKKRK